MKDPESVHTDQHDANVISSAVNSSDEAGQKTMNLQINHIISQQNGRRKTQKFLQKVSTINKISQGRGKRIRER